MPPNHKQVLVKDKHGYNVEIDETIAPLITALWKANLNTLLSCGENNGRVWIEFPVHDFKRFLEIVSPSESDDLYNRIFSAFFTLGEPEPEYWDYAISLSDLGVMETIEGDTIHSERIGKVEAAIQISVRFPLSDYQEVLSRVSKHNELCS